MIQSDKIIKSVRLTEKTNVQSSEIGQYTFEVFKEANKNSIKLAIEKLFDVTVKRVNVINQIGRPRRNRKTGKTARGAGHKKAIVTLKQGDVIDFTA